MIKISRLAKIVVLELNNSGFKAFPVGGCIRDSLLGKIPNDWDITTNALPEEILETFKSYKTIDVGKKFGTIGVEIEGHFIEITTMRKESDYKDSRHPESVVFFDDIYQDLQRRDLTINAMAYDISSNTLIDPFQGQLDLKKKIIKTVGNPDDRFSEDALRILRAIRFSAQLDFRIDYKTLYSIALNSNLIKNVAMERIKVELDKILMANNYPALRTLYNTGIFKHLFPEIDTMFKTEQNNNFHVYNVGDHCLMSVINVADKLNLKYAMLLHDIGKPVAKTSTNEKDHFYNHGKASVKIAVTILDKLKFAKKDKNNILKLIQYHDVILSNKLKSMNKFIVDRDFSLKDIEDLIKVQIADTLSQNPICLDRLNKFNEILNSYIKIYSGPHLISDLVVNGKDMLNLGYTGKNIKLILLFLIKQVIGDPSLNNKETLIEISKKMLKNIEGNKYGTKK